MVLASVGAASHSPMVGPKGSAYFSFYCDGDRPSACFGQGEDVALAFPTAAGHRNLVLGYRKEQLGAGPEDSGDLGR